MLRFENVGFTYGIGSISEKHVLHDVNFEIGTGEFIGLIGSSGAGKTTLIKHMNGLLKATEGAVYFNDENIYTKKYDLKSLRGRVGLVFQYPEQQLFCNTVMEDVSFGPLHMGSDEEEAAKRAKDSLRLVGIDESLYSSSPLELSGGQMRRVAIAGVLAMEPEILVMDEPAAGLDARSKKRIFTLINKIRDERNLSIVLVSHDMEDVCDYADRVLLLENGTIAADESPEEIFNDSELIERTGLKMPDITAAFDKIRSAFPEIEKLPVTVEQAADMFMEVADV